MPYKQFILTIFIACLTSYEAFAGSGESLGDTALPRHYIRPTVYWNNLMQPNRTFKNNPKEYFGFRQNNLGFLFPVYTHTGKDKNGNPGNVFQVVGNANLMVAKPRFSMIDGDHTLARTAFTSNFIYNRGQRDVFFFSLSPFIAEDRSAFRVNPALRYTWMIVYNRTVSENFSFRLGWARTYILGGLPRVPIIGFRLGRYDRVHFNFQFPRYFSLDIPFSGRYNFSVYHRFMGGIYGMREVDFKGTEYQNVILRRTEQVSGLEFTMKASSHFTFFVSAGVVSKSRLGLIDVKSKKLGASNSYVLGYDYASLTNTALNRAGALSLGFQYSFGSARRMYKNTSMNDAIDMNNSFGSGDSNDQGAKLPLPYIPSQTKLKAVQLKDIQDMVSESDLY